MNNEIEIPSYIIYSILWIIIVFLFWALFLNKKNSDVLVKNIEDELINCKANIQHNMNTDLKYLKLREQEQSFNKELDVIKEKYFYLFNN